MIMLIPTSCTRFCLDYICSIISILFIHIVLKLSSILLLSCIYKSLTFASLTLDFQSRVGVLLCVISQY